MPHPTWSPQGKGLGGLARPLDFYVVQKPWGPVLKDPGLGVCIFSRLPASSIRDETKWLPTFKPRPVELK